MTTLTIDVSQLDTELDELLDRRWQFQPIVVPEVLRPQVIPPPPCEVKLVWEIPSNCAVMGALLLRDEECVLTLSIAPDVHASVGDHLAFYLKFTR